MEQWGIFTTKSETKAMTRRLTKAGFKIFEVRPLTIVEKFEYVGIEDTRLFLGEPHVVMFEASKEEYDRFIRKYKLTKMF